MDAILSRSYNLGAHSLDGMRPEQDGGTRSIQTPISGTISVVDIAMIHKYSCSARLARSWGPLDAVLKGKIERT